MEIITTFVERFGRAKFKFSLSSNDSETIVVIEYKRSD